MFRLAALLPVVLVLSLAQCFAAITPYGYYGYGYAPSARSFEIGEVGYSFTYKDLEHALLFRPVSFFEFGANIKKTPEPAVKLLIPSFGEQAKLALGATKDKYYFTSNLKLQTETYGMYYIEVGGIYSKNLHAPVGALTGSANFGVFEFAIENYLYNNTHGTAASVSIKPFVAFDLPSFIEIGTGVAWRKPETKEDFSTWINAQIKYGIPQDTSSKKPLLYIDVSPAFDNSLSFVRSNYNTRVALDIETVLAAPLGFYIVGGFDPSVTSEENERLVRRDVFDRCYLLWSLDSFPMWIGGGMLNSGIYGVQSSIATPFGASRVSLTGGWTTGDVKGFSLVGEVPLLPKFSGVLSQTALFAEGGYFLGEKLAVLLNLRQGSAKNYFQVGAGYEWERPSVFLEANFSFNFNLETNRDRVALRLGSIKHRESSPLYVFQYEYPIYQDGNDRMRLHNFPWSK